MRQSKENTGHTEEGKDVMAGKRKRKEYMDWDKKTEIMQEP